MKYLRLAALAVFGVFMSLAMPSQASATPGQCMNTIFGGYCDAQPWRDGSFQHCENSGFGLFSYSNCFQSCLDTAGRLYPTDIDPDTPC